MDHEEEIMTEIYKTWAWGASKSGPASTLEKTAQLCDQLSAAFQELEIQSILDCGCGDGRWILDVVKSAGIQYLGVDIVEPLVTDLQETATTNTAKFQKMNILRDPPETADLWLARDFLCLYPKPEMMLFFQRFLESKSPFVAITSVDTQRVYQKYSVGSYIQLNLQRDPLQLPEPLMELEDSQQWFCKKWLYIYNRQQILEWFQDASMKQTTAEDAEVPEDHDTLDRNAHLVSNVPLHQMTLYDHRG